MDIKKIFLLMFIFLVLVTTSFAYTEQDFLNFNISTMNNPVYDFNNLNITINQNYYNIVYNITGIYSYKRFNITNYDFKAKKQTYNLLIKDYEVCTKLYSQNDCNNAYLIMINVDAYRKLEYEKSLWIKIQNELRNPTISLWNKFFG